MRKATRKGLTLAVKIALSIVLLWVVLRKVAWPDFIEAIIRIDVRFLLAGAAGLLLSIVVTAYRWWRLLAVQEIRIPPWEAVRLTWLGTFFNYVVLGTTGGDLVKAYYLSRHSGDAMAPLVSVVVDRLLGLTGLTLLSAIMLTIVFASPGYFDAQGRHAEQLVTAAWVAGGVLAFLTAGSAFVFSRRLRRWLRLERFYQRLPLAGQIERAAQGIRRYRHAPRAMARAMGHTFVAHVLFIGGIALLGASLSLAIPWYQYVIYVPLIYIIAAVPIVPGGVGLAENFYVAFFAGLTVAGESSILALALLARLVPMFWALPGVIVAVTGAKTANGDAENAGQEAP